MIIYTIILVGIVCFLFGAAVVDVGQFYLDWELALQLFSAYIVGNIVAFVIGNERS